MTTHLQQLLSCLTEKFHIFQETNNYLYTRSAEQLLYVFNKITQKTNLALYYKYCRLPVHLSTCSSEPSWQSLSPSQKNTLSTHCKPSSHLMADSSHWNSENILGK